MPIIQYREEETVAVDEDSTKEIPIREEGAEEATENAIVPSQIVLSKQIRILNQLNTAASHHYAIMCR